MRFLLIVPLTVVLSGCVTSKDEIAIVRTIQVLKAEASEQALASAQELGEVAVDMGLLTISPTGELAPGKIDPATVEVTPQAARANAGAIAQDRAARNMVKTFAVSFLTEAAKQVPWGTTAIGLLSALWALYRGGRMKDAAVLGVDLLNEAKHLVESFQEALRKPDEETDWDGMAASMASLLGRLKACGSPAGGACEVLTALHAQLKAKTDSLKG